MTFIDPVEQARQSEAAGRLPFIVPLEFRIEYKPQPDGSMREIEWVTWVKKGTQNPATNDERVDRLMKWDTPEWQVIKPYYDNWKKGQTTPVNGVALAAWPGATRELIKALEASNIRTVEDFCDMEDSAIAKLAVPSLRDKQRQARAYRDALKSTAPVSVEVDQLREQNASLLAQIVELRATVEASAPQERKRRGRPPKVMTMEGE